MAAVLIVGLMAAGAVLGVGVWLDWRDERLRRKRRRSPVCYWRKR